MKLYNEEELKTILDDIVSVLDPNFINDTSIALSKPKFGEIWICEIPILVKHNKIITFEKIARPVLVVDDGSEYFIKHDNKNYYVLKITSQKDCYQREKIVNYKILGLQKESFIRIELPIKVEKSQFLYKIGKMDQKNTLNYLRKVKKYLKLNEK